MHINEEQKSPENRQTKKTWPSRSNALKFLSFTEESRWLVKCSFSWPGKHGWNTFLSAAWPLIPERSQRWAFGLFPSWQLCVILDIRLVKILCSFSPGLSWGAKVPDCVADPIYYLEAPPYCLPKWVHEFTVPLAVCGGSLFTTPPCLSQRYSKQPRCETTQMPINRWKEKKDVVHLHDGILLSPEKGAQSLWQWGWTLSTLC